MINKRTKLCVKLKTGTFFEMSATVVPVISAELNRQPEKCLQNKEMTQLLQTVYLADTIPIKNEKSPVEMLIGNDYYLDLISATKIELQPGLYLLHTQLGWILSGRTNETPQCARASNTIAITTECVPQTAYNTQGWESCLDSKQNANTCGSNASDGRQSDVTNNKSESKHNVNACYGNSSDLQKYDVTDNKSQRKHIRIEGHSKRIPAPRVVRNQRYVSAPKSKKSSGIENSLNSNKQQREPDDTCVQRKQTTARHTRRSRKQRVCKRKVRLKQQDV